MAEQREFGYYWVTVVTKYPNTNPPIRLVALFARTESLHGPAWKVPGVAGLVVEAGCRLQSADATFVANVGHKVCGLTEDDMEVIGADEESE